MSDFPALLKQYRERAGLSQSRLAARSYFDHSYVSRLESGARTPTHDAVNRLGNALKLNDADSDRLLVAAGFMPMDVGSLLANEPEVGEVLTLLADESIPLSSRANVRHMLHLITQQVRTPAMETT